MLKNLPTFFTQLKHYETQYHPLGWYIQTQITIPLKSYLTRNRPGYAVQIAKNLGTSVTGVCSTRNTRMVSELGAAADIDYTKEDYTRLGRQFDIVFDAVGKTGKSQAKQVLKKSGAFVSVNMMTSERQEDLYELTQMAEEGLLKPFIDRSYSLDQLVEAHAYVDQGHKRGNVVVEVVGH